MDPCPFVRLLVGNLALKLPEATKPEMSVIHPSSPCFCTIKLKNFPIQTSVIPLLPSDSDAQTNTASVSFHLTKSDIEKLLTKSIFSAKLRLKISVYIGRTVTTCGLNTGRLLGAISIPLDLTSTESKPRVFHNGWIEVGNHTRRSPARLHLSVKSEPDPRFVFQFEGEPECSPQVFQIQGNLRQPVFTCRFSFRNNADRNQQRSSFSESSSRSWLNSFGSDRERIKERKGWSVTVHDLSGSSVAAAAMVTPFVPSPGSDRVSRSNPGSWLILRPDEGTWKPWGRLEAWRERGSRERLGYRFELITGSTGVVLAESALSLSKGGQFIIDTGCTASGFSTPKSSGDFGYALWPYGAFRGFVMAARVQGEGKCSNPVVEVGVQHVTCTEDAAGFVALAAAVDLSIDACKLFSQKLRKELSPCVGEI